MADHFGDAELATAPSTSSEGVVTQFGEGALTVSVTPASEGSVTQFGDVALTTSPVTSSAGEKVWYGAVTLAVVPSTAASGAMAKTGSFAVVLDVSFDLVFVYRTESPLGGVSLSFDTFCQLDPVSVVPAIDIEEWPTPPVPGIDASFDQVYTGGAKITAVVTGGKAHLAGLAVNDVILEVEGTTIDSAADLVAFLADTEPGDILAMVVDRP